ncbi:MAG: ATPase domain-containing protein [Thermoproteus sp. AZ2]|uniref:ATPase domain-containing protein n=1 Tax=Thermoproteus sp. AZ2 TaxID=1609232 RepID=A0ACC6UYV4_9CREN|nr:MAG: recombination protein RecA [Thermoproteus sp. AZ2]
MFPGVSAYVADQYYQYYVEDRAPTGVWYVDQLLNGGFKRGEIYLVAGEAGQGKTIFSLQFLKTGAELYEEPGLYITVDEPSEDVKRGVKASLGWDLDALEEQQKLVFVDLRTHFKAYAQSEKVTADPREVAKVIIDHVRKYNIKRLVIDPIAPLLITSHTDVLWVREYMRELVFQLKRLKDVTTVMTSEIPTGENKISRFGVEEYLASGVIKLELQEYRGFVFRVMFIRKMRWTPVRPQKLVFEIYPQYGIYVIDRLENFIKSIDGWYAQMQQPALAAPQT